MVDRNQQPRIVDDPAPCFVRMQLVRGGVFVAARIFHRMGMLAAEINGQTADPFQVWHAGDQITQADYELMMQRPEPNPYRQVHMSSAGMAVAINEQAEQDALYRRTIR